jgi:hypothetical protein
MARTAVRGEDARPSADEIRGCGPTGLTLTPYPSPGARERGGLLVMSVPAGGAGDAGGGYEPTGERVDTAQACTPAERATWHYIGQSPQ